VWRAEFESELLRFPAGVHDDQVDMLSLLGQLLDHISAPRRATGRQAPAETGYRATGGGESDSFKTY